MKGLPTTFSSFDEIIEKNLLYVDKTQQVLRFLKKGKYLFLSRPRRFGKSLLISTLQALYQGKKELFNGLYIYDKWEWKEYPIIALDFSTFLSSRDKAAFEESVNFALDKIAYTYDIDLKSNYYIIKLNELIWKLELKIGQKVVVLIDEYDKPITDFIDNPVKTEENRTLLKEFYTTLKGLHQHLELVFITGVSKLAKLSVFSGMNNVLDLTLIPELNDVVGLTLKDITNYFGGYIEALQEKTGYDRNQLLDAIKHWYDGYSWDAINHIYNPYSIVHLFSRLEFRNFWYESGTPTFLIKLIIQRAREKNLQRNPEYYENIKVTEGVFNSADVTELSVEGFLFQTGYLTIKKIERFGLDRLYYLNYPNHEVRWSFSAHILESFAEIPKRELEPGAFRLKYALQAGDRDEFIKLLRSYFALIPYQLRKEANEAYYHSIFHILFTLLGINFLSERSIEKGRIDGIAKFDDKICIIEFKYSTVGTLDDLARSALQQIKDKRYAQPYFEQNKPIYLLGVGFLEKDKHLPESNWTEHGRLDIEAVWDEV